MSDGNTLGARLERARVRAGLNKNQLARAVGTSWQHIDSWERDRVAPSTASLRRLATALGVDLASLLDAEAPDPIDRESALGVFLARYAPADLTEAETAWLRAAPVEPSVATPGLYLDLLHRLRSSAPTARPTPTTGKRAKVHLDDLPPEARAVLAAQGGGGWGHGGGSTR